MGPWNSQSLTLDRSSGHPLYRQIVAGVRRLIENHQLAPGVKLPSSRELSERLSVHRTTVTSAYRRLAELGLVSSGVGQGTFVAQVRRSAGPERGRAPARISWSGFLGSTSSHTSNSFRPAVTHGTVVMDRAIPDPELYPMQELQDILTQLVAAAHNEMFSYGPSAGDETLRALLASRLAARGVAMDDNELLIVGGSQQGLDLVARLFLRDGGAVVVDSPSYRGALEVFHLNGAEIVGVPMRDGRTDLDALESLLERRRVRLIYTMPSMHNPSGQTLDEHERRRLYDLAHRVQVPILEDDWLADLGRPGDPPPVKALDRAGCVIHSGTFSKTAVPGFRVGWLVVPKELFDVLLELKSNCDLSTGLVGQKVLSGLLENDLYDAHVARVREHYEQRLQHGLATLERQLPDSVSWTRPERGIVNWLELPDGVDGMEVARAAAQRDVLVSPGELYMPDGRANGGLRLCYSLCTPAHIDQGIERLAEAIDEVMERNRRGSRSAPPPIV